MRTKLTLWINIAIAVAVALWFFILPSASLIRTVRDLAGDRGGIPRCVYPWHQHLTKKFTAWAQGRVTGKMGAGAGQYDIAATEWPAHSAMFYLLATEEMQKAWEKDHSLSLVAPRDYAREAIDAAAALLRDPVNATWVRKYWGDDRYLKTQDVFFRMMVINGLTAHLYLTGDKSNVEFLKEQAASLAAEFDASQWGVLDDYPGEAYPVDIVPTIAGIQRVDQVSGDDHSAIVARAVRVLEGGALDPACGMPGYLVDMHTGLARQPARGIGMSMTLVWTPQLWPARSMAWYADYVSKFWQEDWLLAGFREFRKGTGHADWQMEIDAGPVIAGYGTTATAFGIGAARAHGDLVRARMLTMEAVAGAWPLPDDSMPGARLLSTPDAPFTGETAMLFALTRESFQIPAPHAPAPHAADLVTPDANTGAPLASLTSVIPPATPSPFPVAGDHIPAFVLVFIGGGMLLGVLMLLASWLRAMRPRHFVSRAIFGVWAVLVLGGGALWWFHPWWGAIPLVLAQIFPVPARRPKMAADPYAFSAPGGGQGTVSRDVRKN